MANYPVFSKIQMTPQPTKNGDIEFSKAATMSPDAVFAQIDKELKERKMPDPKKLKMNKNLNFDDFVQNNENVFYPYLKNRNQIEQKVIKKVKK